MQPYTQVRLSGQYNNPIVTVNRNVLANTPTNSDPSPVPDPRAAAAPRQNPPFIISNSLAAASGLNANMRRPSLATSPVDTPFASAEDVVDRLLPYHVWLLPEKDLLLGMQGKLISRPAEACDEDAACTFAVPYKRAKYANSAQDTLLTLPPFPSVSSTLYLYERRAKLVHGCKAIKTKADTTYMRAPEMLVSQEQLERTLYEDEMRDFQDLSNELRRARAQLEEIERQRNWRFGVPAAASLSIPTRDWATSWNAKRFVSPSTPDISRRLESLYPSQGYGANAPITRPFSVASSSPRPSGNAPLPALTHALVSHLAGLTSGGVRALQSAGSANVPSPPSSSAIPLVTPKEDGSQTSVPTQPLPLVVPVAAVPRLTALGIHLVPATHLIPALSLASAGQSVAMNPGLTAPRPIVGVQNEPVLLVGITDAHNPGMNPSSRQRLHLSVVLAKLRPEQLSGLATLMQALQAEEEAPAPTQPDRGDTV
ncbi:hypothetical protein MVES_000401 [Malassezia vespertilionis]|uniref:GLTSCR protein conserved domain-containing protein n=1 Tax=Malassezia vespertilionis TaxID=2020962 RepID=A0A2N1JHD5_9BASI|nr:hypothetical protein MVES_000401 [Malassezia vespertilionis]